MTPSPSLSLLASLLLSLAHALAPKEDKFWIGDMRLEAPFVPNQFQFAFSALLLALKFRWKELRQNRPGTLAFASVTVAALATLLFVPRLFNNPPIANDAMSAAPGSYETTSEYLQGAAADRGLSADAQIAEPGVVTVQTETTTPSANAAPATELESSGDETVTEVPSATDEPIVTQSGEGFIAEALPPPEASEPLAIPPPPVATAPEQGAMDVTSATSPAEQSLDASVPIEAQSPATTATESAAPDDLSAGSSLNQAPDTLSQNEVGETGAGAELAALPPPLTPSANTTVLSTQVREDSISLNATDAALLTIYRNSDFAGSPRIHRYVEAGETLTFGIPFSLYTDNASAITVTVDGSSFALGEEDEEQFRVFTKP